MTKPPTDSLRHTHLLAKQIFDKIEPYLGGTLSEEEHRRDDEEQKNSAAICRPGAHGYQRLEECNELDIIKEEARQQKAQLDLLQAHYEVMQAQLETASIREQTLRETMHQMHSTMMQTIAGVERFTLEKMDKEIREFRQETLESLQVAKQEFEESFTAMETKSVAKRDAAGQKLLEETRLCIDKIYTDNEQKAREAQVDGKEAKIDETRSRDFESLMTSMEEPVDGTDFRENQKPNILRDSMRKG